MEIEFWKELAGLAANLVLLATAITAARGVARWAKEHKGRKRIDLAEDLLATSYEAREAISFMRGPFAWDSESKDLVRDEGESEADFRRRKTYSVAYFRYQQHADLFSKLRTLCYRVEAAFGKTYGEPIRTVLMAPSRVITAGNSLARMSTTLYHGTEEQSRRQFELRQKLEGDFWEGLGDNDTLTPVLDQAVAAIEKFAQLVIENDGEAGKPNRLPAPGYKAPSAASDGAREGGNTQ